MLKTKAIIIHKTNFRESSFIVKCYTQELGMKSYFVPGVRKKKAKFASTLFFPLSTLDLIAYNSIKKSINYVKDIRPIYNYYEIYACPSKSAISFIICEILNKTILEQTNNDQLFNFLIKEIQTLENLNSSRSKLFLIKFIIKYINFVGFGILEANQISKILKQNNFNSLSFIQEKKIDEIICNNYSTDIHFENSDIIQKLINLLKANFATNIEIKSYKVCYDIL